MALLAATSETVGSSGEAVWAEMLGTALVLDTALHGERLGCTAELEAASESTTVPEGPGLTPSVSRRRRWGHLSALLPHVRFLQVAFRRTTGRWPGCWTAGGLAGKMWLRPVVQFACRGGANLASAAAFAAQSDLAARANGWYRHYVSLLRRLSSGHTPVAVVAFCGHGGLAEGVRRAGGASHGVDRVAQPAYSRRFGSETFSEGDPTSVSELSDLRKRSGSFVTFISPPSGVSGGSAGVDLESTARDACEAAGGLYVLETARENAPVGKSGGCRLRGAYFGLHVDHPRSFAANFDLRVDEALVEPGLVLRRGSCLGARRRWSRRDPFGRTCTAECCSGNLWAVQGDAPVGCTVGECAAAMGVDHDHMDYPGLTMATPPVYGEYVFGQAAMREVERRFGLRAITFDEYLAHPERSRRQMSHWLRGVGGMSPDQGVEFHSAPVGGSVSPSVVSSAARSTHRDAVVPGRVDPSYRPKFPEGDEAPVAQPTAETVLSSEARELFY